MARKIWLTLGVIGIAVVLGFGMYQSNASNAEPTLAVADIEELVTSQYPGTITELELTKGTNGAVYEVEIANDSVEYELEIDGESGEIINLKERLIAIKDQDNTEEHIDLKEKEKEEKEKQEKEQKAKQKQQDEKDKNKEQLEKTQIEKKQNDKQKKKKESKSKHTVIDVNKAIDIALEQFPGVVDEAELDEEDGRLIYEIEIEGNGEEAEFEIDAYTGEVLVVEIEDD